MPTKKITDDDTPKHLVELRVWLRLQLRRAAEVWEVAEEDMIEGEDGGAEVSPSRTCCVSLSKVARN